jgi:hypothetical protein
MNMMLLKTIIIRCLFALTSCLLLTGFGALRGAEETPGRYFLVVDHSGSMLQKVKVGPASGRSRWDLMRERSAGFVSRLPDGSDVWIGVFSALPDRVQVNREDPFEGWLTPFRQTLDSPTERESLITRLQSFPEPNIANGTWLYQATGEALNQVALAGARDPDAYMTVLVYTDGVDQGHGRTNAEMLRNPGSSLSREQLEQLVARLRKNHRNFNIVNVYRPGDESILDAHVVRLLTNRLQLASPLCAPNHEVEIGFSFRDDERLKIGGKPLSLEWEESPSEGITIPPLSIQGGPFTLINGTIKVVLEKSGVWPAGRDIHARLRIKYSQLPQTFLVEEGGSSIDVYIQGAEAPSIRDLLPADGSAFPVGREIGFSLSTLADCDVTWDFGDGTTARGHSVRHTYAAPGEKRASVKVTDPRTQLNASANLTLELSELKLALDPFPMNVTPGKEITITASASGDFRDFDWDVGGRTYAGKARSDGAAGSSLSITFERPGPVEIKLRGNGRAGGFIETDPTTLLIRAVPAIRVTAPAPGESIYFGSTRELRAEVEGIEANSLRFTVISGSEIIMQARDVDVRREGSLRSAVLPWNVPMLEIKAEATLIVEPTGGNQSLRREIPIILESEPAHIEIVLPDGREPHIHQETPVRLETNARISEVRWNFGDGWREGSNVERHIWKSYGTFEIQVEAKGPDGSPLAAIPVEVKIPVRPASANSTVIYNGRAVGAEIAKVPVNSTLELQANTAGDVIASSWYLDGNRLPDGQKTITVKERGFKTLRLVADATPEAGGIEAASSTIEFRTSDKIVFWSLVAALFTALVVAARLLLGNKWRFAELHVGRKTEGSYSDGDRIKMPWGIKSWWTKRSEIAMAALDKKTCTAWNGDTRLRFESGKDPKLVALGRQWNNNRLNPESSKNLNPSYMKRWTFTRIPLTTIRQDHEHAKGSVNLMIPQLKPGIVGRWPEFLFMGFLLGSVAAVRLLFEWLY